MSADVAWTAYQTTVGGLQSDKIVPCSSVTDTQASPACTGSTGLPFSQTSPVLIHLIGSELHLENLSPSATFPSSLSDCCKTGWHAPRTTESGEELLMKSSLSETHITVSRHTKHNTHWPTPCPEKKWPEFFLHNFNKESKRANDKVKEWKAYTMKMMMKEAQQQQQQCGRNWLGDRNPGILASTVADLYIGRMKKGFGPFAAEKPEIKRKTFVCTGRRRLLYLNLHVNIDYCILINAITGTMYSNWHKVCSHEPLWLQIVNKINVTTTW